MPCAAGFVTHARGLQTAQVPLAPSRGLGGECEILEGVVRAIGAEVTQREGVGELASEGQKVCESALRVLSE